MKRLVSHEVMSGKAEVMTSSEFAYVADTDSNIINILFTKSTKLG